MASSNQNDPPTRLEDCPDKPNCVSSVAQDEKHFIEPIGFSGSAGSAMARMRLAVSNMSGATIRSTTDTYVRAEYRSRLFGFVDDLELLLDPDNSQFHVRSASRTGYYDFNANSKRVEALRDAFTRMGAEG